MEVRVSADMLRKPMDEYNSGLDRVGGGLVCTRVELGGIGSGEPGFGISLGGHAFYTSMQGWGEGSKGFAGWDG